MNLVRRSRRKKNFFFLNLRREKEDKEVNISTKGSAFALPSTEKKKIRKVARRLWSPALTRLYNKSFLYSPPHMLQLP